ncbi:hypothetical protein BJ138DRAFT_1168306 [Hygrophoropsis aurantiaca]|uniref:Uncharacterized protein n=1 Tax=Hygrophoropsis aurantiaca TaxID=72124 RepID=A0ACB7ZQY0_9AGAM|nr:hypothetical protein BJ138DRAFT_1168306 [Hygrophoropsis aurantiaca]
MDFLNYFTFDLEEIHISFESEPQSTQSLAGYLLEALASSLSRNANYISVRDRYLYSHYSRQRVQLVGIQEFRPLLQFQELQNLDLIFAESIVVDDATLLAIADAWPNISALTLNEDLSLRPQFAGSHVTPSAFITFLERCPNLTNLTIPFDFSVIDHANFDPFSIAGLGGVTSHA